MLGDERRQLLAELRIDLLGSFEPLAIELRRIKPDHPGDVRILWHQCEIVGRERSS